MDNKIQELFKSIPDQELENGILEIQEAEKSGIFSMDSTIRSYIKKVYEITEGANSGDIMMVQIGFLKEAAYRWLSIAKN